MYQSSTLEGNHGSIRVPYAFTGNVIEMNTIDESERGVLPYNHWDPMWKSGRYIYDVNLLKPTSSGLHYSEDGSCSGTAIYMSATGMYENRLIKHLDYLWGNTLQGIRIAGNFTYGIKVHNIDGNASGEKEDNAWNHDMRIEAII
jgi:hypothetical protein